MKRKHSLPKEWYCARSCIYSDVDERYKEKITDCITKCMTWKMKAFPAQHGTVRQIPCIYSDVDLNDIKKRSLTVSEVYDMEDESIPAQHTVRQISAFTAKEY
ncbi:hypothetical protein AVEN_258026-1 [Araneus ventricosus]|uniref:Uncharacterized protein n=1 Tax=Araneus ventricosus TaxID=182803 RepID=A0A4Y2VU30_ARAVE|nr:hypothetical protein AVEN_258026-1 [Araneus ventricosus]